MLHLHHLWKCHPTLSMGTYTCGCTVCSAGPCKWSRTKVDEPHLLEIGHCSLDAWDVVSRRNTVSKLSLCIYNLGIPSAGAFKVHLKVQGIDYRILWLIHSHDPRHTAYMIQDICVNSTRGPCLIFFYFDYIIYIQYLTEVRTPLTFL